MSRNQTQRIADLLTAVSPKSASANQALDIARLGGLGAESEKVRDDVVAWLRKFFAERGRSVDGDVNPDVLKVVDAICDYGNVVEIAEALGVSVSTLQKMLGKESYRPCLDCGRSVKVFLRRSKGGYYLSGRGVHVLCAECKAAARKKQEEESRLAAKMRMRAESEYHEMLRQRKALLARVPPRYGDFATFPQEGGPLVDLLRDAAIQALRKRDWDVIVGARSTKIRWWAPWDQYDSTEYRRAPLRCDVCRRTDGLTLWTGDLATIVVNAHIPDYQGFFVLPEGETEYQVEWREQRVTLLELLAHLGASSLACWLLRLRLMDLFTGERNCRILCDDCVDIEPLRSNLEGMFPLAGSYRYAFFSLADAQEDREDNA